MSKVAKVLKKIFFTQMSITSSKMKIFELFKNKNWNSNIFPQTSSSRFWILAFKFFWDAMEKSHFFQKKQKNPNFKIPSRSKKKISEKSSSTKFLCPLGESMFKKSAKSEMVTGRLVDSYKKPLLKRVKPSFWFPRICLKLQFLFYFFLPDHQATYFFQF
jgi:hypothetical protein